MVKLTVVLITKRSEPHLDWALQSLRNQTFRDFEYIIVDGYYNRRKDEVAKLIKDMDISFPVLHIPDKASRWKGQRPCISNARNTALVFANGRYMVFADDCCKMRPNWLERHNQFLDKGYLVAGAWIGCQSIDKNGNCVPGIYGPEDRSNTVTRPAEVTNTWLYGGNMSFPLQAALDINGFDEMLDGEFGQDDTNFAIRLGRKGYKTIFDPECMIEYYMTDHIYDKIVSPVEKVLRDGVKHFSNEYLTQKLIYEEMTKVWTWGNTIDMQGARKLFGSGNGFGNWTYPLEEMFKMMESWIDGNKFDWRDGKLVEEKINNEPKWEMK